MAVFEDRKVRATRGRQEDERPDRKVFWLVGLVVAGLLILWVVFAPGRGYYHFRKMQREIDMLAAENSRLEARNLEMAQAAAAQRDPAGRQELDPGCIGEQFLQQIDDAGKVLQGVDDEQELAHVSVGAGRPT